VAGVSHRGSPRWYRVAFQRQAAGSGVEETTQCRDIEIHREERKEREEEKQKGRGNPDSSHSFHTLDFFSK
jgi:hypothetical protein